MAKFNDRTVAIPQTQALTEFGPNAVNKAGGWSYTDTPAMALYKQVATSLWQGDGYYEGQPEWFMRFQQNVNAAMMGNTRFPFALAAYARDKVRGLKLRTSPVGLYTEASMLPWARKTGLVRQYAPKVLLRADEPAEVISYFKAHATAHDGKKPALPNGLRRGLADVLLTLNEYELAKYDDTGDVSMRDVFRIARPHPKDDAMRALFGRVVSKTLATPYTWEVELTNAHTDEEKRRVWNALLESGKLGTLALMRNLRNIVKVNADLEIALSQFTRESVAKAGILPFQWYTAYKALAEAGGLAKDAAAEQMQNALTWSLDGFPKLPGSTLAVCDNSSSMDAMVNARPARGRDGKPTKQRSRGMSNKEIGNLFGAMTIYACEKAVAGTFGSTFAVANTSMQNGLLDNYYAIESCGTRTGHSTDAWTIFQTLTSARVWVDRVVLFSDQQCYDSSIRYSLGGAVMHSLNREFEVYRNAVNPNCVLYSVNLDSQDNTSQFAPNVPVVALAGFSEQIFGLIAAMEAGDNVLDIIQANY